MEESIHATEDRQTTFLKERSEYRVSFLHPEKPPKEVVTGFWDKKVRKHRKRVQTYNWLDWLAYIFPCVTWIRTYNVKQWLFWDILAGLSVGFMVIPQGMSYANVANLPAIFGLYGAFVPTLTYAVFGTSGQLAVGPVAVTSLLLGTGLQDLFGGKVNSSPNTPADPCLQNDYNRAAVQVAFLAGLMYTAIGFLGLGWIVNFLSRAVISGFMTAAATIILLGQVKYILGVSVPKVDPVHQQLTNLIDAVKVPGAFSWREFVMGMTFIVFLLFLRWAGRRKIRGIRLLLLGAMGPLLVTIIGTASMNIFKWYQVYPITTTTATTVKTNATNSTLTLASYCAVLANSTNVTATAATLTTLYSPSQCNTTKTSNTTTTTTTTTNTTKTTNTTNTTTTATVNSCATSLYNCLNGNLTCFQKATSASLAVKCLNNVSSCVTTGTTCLSVSPCTVKVAKANKTTAPLIKPVGSIPSGMPQFTAGWFFPMYDFGQQFVLAVIICFVDICESISIAKAMAQRKHYEIDGTKELQGLGIANIMGSLFNCYTTTGSFSRTSVNYSVGAQTPLANFVTGIVIMLTLLFATSLFTNMPQNVQGAIIIAAVIGIMDFGEAWFLFKVSKIDCLVWVVAWLCTMFLGVETGIGISVGCSVLLVVMHTAFPSVRMLGCLPNTAMYRDVKQYPDAKPIQDMLIVRVDAPIYFANIPRIKDWINRRLRKCKERGIPIRVLIVDLSPVSAVDASAIHFFLNLLETLKHSQISLQLVNPKAQVAKLLRDGGVLKKLDENSVHVVVHDAVLYAQDLLANTKLISDGTLDHQSNTSEHVSSSNVVNNPELNELELEIGAGGATPVPTPFGTNQEDTIVSMDGGPGDDYKLPKSAFVELNTSSEAPPTRVRADDESSDSMDGIAYLH